MSPVYSLPFKSITKIKWHALKSKAKQNINYNAKHEKIEITNVKSNNVL